jgi:hypothetical protein
VRTLTSWLRIPSAYGVLDAERVRAGTLEEEFVAGRLESRHRATQVLTGLCRKAPALIEPMSQGVCRLASALYGMGARKAGLSALSAVYNARYTTSYLTRLEKPGA